MALVTKNDVTQIFAIQAPEVDLPPTFANYPRGWDTARSNNGKPTIKQFNYIQQRTDQNVLWIHQNGAALPYDATMEYAENAVVVKDGELQKKQGASWVLVANKGYSLDYFVSGKSYPLHAEIMLENGDIVKSTVSNNIINPNVAMTGWVRVSNTIEVESIDELLAIQNPKDGTFAKVKSYVSGKNIGGGDLIFDSASTVAVNNVTVFGANPSGRWFRPIDEVITPYHAGAVDETNSIDALDRFAIAFYSSAERSRYSAVGSFKISRPFNFVLKNNTSLNWGLRLEASTPMSYIIALRGTGLQHTGKLTVLGTGLENNYDSMGVDFGVVLNGTQGNSLPEISANRVKVFGVITDEGNSISTIPLGSLSYAGNTIMSASRITARDCGCATVGSFKNKTSGITFSNPVHTGTSGTPSQKTTLTLSENIVNTTLPIKTAFAVINNKTYLITDMDLDKKEISLFPWLDTTEPTSGTINFFWGGGVASVGSNVGPFKIGTLDTMRTAISLLDGGLYGTVCSNIVSQFVTVGHVIGASPDSVGPQSSAVFGFYTESMYRNVVSLSQGSAQYFDRMGAFSGAEFINCERISPNNRAGDNGAFADSNLWRKVIMPSQEGSGLAGIHFKGRRSNQDQAGSFISLRNGEIVPKLYKKNTWTVSLQYNNILQETKGLDDAIIGFIGTGANGAPTGAFTFNPPSGWTVNGGASVVFSGFGGAAMFMCYWEIATKNIIVSLISQKASTQADSVAIDVAALKTDFNALLAKLRVVGLLAN